MADFWAEHFDTVIGTAIAGLATLSIASFGWSAGRVYERTVTMREAKKRDSLTDTQTQILYACGEVDCSDFLVAYNFGGVEVRAAQGGEILHKGNKASGNEWREAAESLVEKGFLRHGKGEGVYPLTAKGIERARELATE